MNTHGPLIAPTAWVERYESLRRYVLEGRQRLPSQPLGLALWLAQGMAGWMKQWAELIPTAGSPPGAVLSRPAVGGPWQQPLTMLLAQMTLAQLQPQAPL